MKNVYRLVVAIGIVGAYAAGQWRAQAIDTNKCYNFTPSGNGCGSCEDEECPMCIAGGGGTCDPNTHRVCYDQNTAQEVDKGGKHPLTEDKKCYALYYCVVPVLCDGARCEHGQWSSDPGQEQFTRVYPGEACVITP